MSQQQQMQAQQDANRQNLALTKEGIREQRRQFDIGREDRFTAGAQQEDINRQIMERFRTAKGENIERLDPYSKAGIEATQIRSGLLGLGTPEQQAAAEARFTESPGQRFLRKRQEEAILRTAAARGGLGGGNVMRELQEEAFGRAQTDRERYLAQLGGLSREGLTAAGEITGMGYGPMIGETDVYSSKLEEMRAQREKEQAEEAARKKRQEEERRRREMQQQQQQGPDYGGEGGSGGMPDTGTTGGGLGPGPGETGYT
jgi:hypothetical protein